MGLIKSFLQLAIFLMMIAIFGSVIISWLRASRVRVPSSNPLVRLVEDAANLMLEPIRRAMPTTAGRLDFAPMVAIIILYILRALAQRL